VATLKSSLGLRAALLSLLIFAAIVGLWQIATQPTAGSGPAVDPEYAKLVGAAAATGAKSAMPIRWAVCCWALPWRPCSPCRWAS
jgi:nitrate/nitrite transport system permease protein